MSIQSAINRVLVIGAGISKMGGGKSKQTSVVPENSTAEKKPLPIGAIKGAGAWNSSETAKTESVNPPPDQKTQTKKPTAKKPTAKMRKQERRMHLPEVEKARESMINAKMERYFGLGGNL